ncbi:MAG TPA: c-type cytochrome domain-containing protein, partial [Puia sp.]|nr:c-type cytochrome domain-containing protein [Puia sp.]
MNVKTIGSSLIPLNAILLFFLLLEDRIVVPSWLQVAGRLHPMILHFPIVLIIVYALWEWIMVPALRKGAVGPTGMIPGRDWTGELADGLLLGAAVTAAITAIMGFLLSREPEYDGAAVGWHKWLGALTSFGLLGLWFFRSRLRSRPMIGKLTAAAVLVLVMVAGHLGGTITHGENFVLHPLFLANSNRAPFDEAYVYKDLVAPIFESKCGSCHGGGNAKGELALDSKEGLLKGGKDGKLWDTTDAGLGLLMNRIRLPQDEKKHMPPLNKPQLTDVEESILNAWIRSGSDFTKKLIELPPSDTLRILASGILKATAEEKYDFAAAGEKKVQELNSNYRSITPLASGSPALAVDFYGAAFFRSAQLKELEPLRHQIVALNLDKMPVTDQDLAIIAGFDNLRTLNLSFSKITGAGLPALTGLKHLKTLSLAGTAVNAEAVHRLGAIKTLRSLYIWNTGIAAADIGTLQKERNDLAVITGFRADTVHIKLNAPRIGTEDRVIRSSLSLELKHFVPGVTMKYTLDNSDPDSAGIVYNGPVLLTSHVNLKAKAYKKGWLASDEATASFFSEKYRPDSILLLKPVDSNYMKFRPGVLIDLDKGDLNFGSGKWLGFRKKGLECLLFFRTPVRVEDITLSSIVDVNSFIMPPVKVEVWGGKE